MLAIDKERAASTMKSWQKFVDVVSSRHRSEPFKGLDDYLPYRISDAGELSAPLSSCLSTPAYKM
jgi:hypothetical protein